MKLSSQSVTQEEIFSLWDEISWEVEGKEVNLSGSVSLDENGAEGIR